ncbi:MAG: DNA topoisomerase [Acidithiobacillus ferrivorans]
MDEVLEELRWKGPTQRIWLAALDEQSVRKALALLKNNRDYQNLSNSAEARARADWLMGMNLTHAFTLRNSGAGVVSVGRVQTPTLALVVARDEKTEHLNPRTTTFRASTWASGLPGNCGRTSRERRCRRLPHRPESR